MRIFSTLCMLTLLLLFVISSAPAYAQDQNEKKLQQDTKQQQNDNAKPQEDRTTRPDEGKRQEEPNARPEERQNRPEATRPEEQQPRDQRREQEQHPMQNSPRSGENMGRNQHQHPAAQQGKHIPDDQFRAHFGKQHTFHVQRTHILNVSQPVIVFGGYSFELIEAWPADWGFDDDCYIDFIDDEYFLFDVLHAGVRIAVIVIG